MIFPHTRYKIPYKNTHTHTNSMYVPIVLTQVHYASNLEL